MRTVEIGDLVIFRDGLLRKPHSESRSAGMIVQIKPYFSEVYCSVFWLSGRMRTLYGGKNTDVDIKYIVNSNNDNMILV